MKIKGKIVLAESNISHLHDADGRKREKKRNAVLAPPRDFFFFSFPCSFG